MLPPIVSNPASKEKSTYTTKIKNDDDSGSSKSLSSEVSDGEK